MPGGEEEGQPLPAEGAHDGEEIAAVAQPRPPLPVDATEAQPPPLSFSGDAATSGMAEDPTPQLAVETPVAQELTPTIVAVADRTVSPLPISPASSQAEALLTPASSTAPDDQEPEPLTKRKTSHFRSGKSKSSQALPKIPRGAAASRRASTSSRGAGGTDEDEHSTGSTPSMYDLEWQHAVDASKADSYSKQSTKGFATAEGDAVDLGPMFANRAKKDSRQVDQSVNLMQQSDRFENDSLNSASHESMGKSGRSAKSKSSVGRMSLVAPVRPRKFAKRPSHVNIRTDEIMTDESLIGVVEGRAGTFRSQRDKASKADVSNADAIDPSNKKQTALDRTKSCFVLLAKILVVVGFIAYGVYLNLKFNEYASSSTSRSGEMQAEVATISEGSSSIIDEAEHRRVHMPHHVASPTSTELVVGGLDYPPSPAPPNLVLGDIASIIIRHEISLPKVLGYAGNVDEASLNPQRRALLWLAETNALAIAEDARDAKFVRLLQRYALAVFYFSVGGHFQPDPDSESGPPAELLVVDHDVSRIEREIHIVNEDNKEKRIYKGWRRKMKWMSQYSVCEWYGVKCNGEDMVETLNLTSNGLKGQLPMLELFQALRESLKRFDVSHNEISGSLTLPMNLTKKPWVQLEHFCVNDNQITGVPPFGWFDIPLVNSLLIINMARNLFSGELPNSAISNFEALKELYLSYNLLNGNLPHITNLPSLEILHFNNNLFHGSIPTSIFFLTSLVDLNLGSNDLTGPLSIDLALLQRLETLSLENNSIDGHLPDRFNSLSNLKTMNASNNHFSGTLPHSLSSVTSIETLSLERNQFSGIFPESYANLTKLSTFLIDHNDIYGSIPAAFCQLKASFFHVFNYLTRFEADCLHEIVCDCCDSCY